jgi:peptidoglycan/xylan/chitin deacetylase (PgdA/CDA1 family)
MGNAVLRFGTILALLLTAAPLVAETPKPALPATPAEPAVGVPESKAADAGYGGVRSATNLGYNSVNTAEPVVALTFDDGPHATLTPRLLDILKARQVKATFFILGQLAREYPDIMARIAAEGHEIANHSWSHPNCAKLGDGAVHSQISRTMEAIEATAKVKTDLFRPPYGSITARQRQWLTRELGLKIIMWSVDPLDWKNRNAATVESRLVEGAHPGAIMLAHDIHPSTVNAIPGTLDRLLAKGYRFATVSELLAMDRPRATPTPSAPATTGTAPATEPAAVRAEPVVR